MEEDNATRTGPNANVVGVKSWVAYLGLTLLAAIAYGVLLPLAFLWHQFAAAGVMLVATALLVYRFLMIRSVQLYYDDIGVWVYSGVLPWQKGYAGVKWRDMDEASFEQGFWSWITRSYSIRIGHRFTKESEIRLTQIANGKDAVATLNGKHQDMIRAGLVQ
jgi:hypothetical protein